MKPVVISINLHTTELLQAQLENFNRYIKVPFNVIYHCANETIMDQVKQLTRDRNNIIINPTCYEKTRFTPLLVKGTIDNMKYYKWYYSYFIIASHRCYFYKELTSSADITINIVNQHNDYVHANGVSRWQYGTCINWDSEFIRCRMGLDIPKYFKSINGNFSISAAWGLTFDYGTCRLMVKFLTDNNDMYEQFFTKELDVAEEWLLQTISTNMRPGNKFYHLGNGVTAGPLIPTSNPAERNPKWVPYTPTKIMWRDRHIGPGREVPK